MNELQHLSLATTYEVDESFDSEKFIKMRLRVCHDGVNPNKSNFIVSDMENAKDSIKNIPILANVIFDEDGQPQFGGHDMTLEPNKIKEGEYKVIFQETPIGLVPENCNHEIKEFNGKNYVFVDAYIWREYSNYAEDIIERDENIKLSMEIIIDGYTFNAKDKVFNITDYRYQGITFLNKDSGTGMENALGTTGTFEEYTKQKFILMMEELKNTLSNYDIDKTDEGGSNVDEKMELLAKYNLTVEQLDFNIDEISLEELEEKLKEFSKSEPDNVVTFSATYRQKREALANALDPKIEKDADGNLIYEEYQWVEDFDDTHVFVEKSIWTPGNHECKYGRFTYTFNDETLTATIDGEFEEMVLVWLTLEENQTLQDERDNASAEFQKLKDEFEDYKTNYSVENSEVERLQKFEQDALTTQRKEAEEILFAQFDEKLQGIAEYEELKTTAFQFELDVIERECYVILGKQNANFSTKPKNKVTDKVKLGFSKIIEDTNSRDELFEKYLK